MNVFDVMSGVQIPESVQIITAMTAVLGAFKVWDGHRGKRRDTTVKDIGKDLGEKLEKVQQTATSTQQTIQQVIIPRVEAAHSRITRIEKERERERERKMRALEERAKKRRDSQAD